MNKQTVSVINTGRRVRDRLGSRFLPNQERILKVNGRQYLTLKAVKDFKVTIVDNNESNQVEKPEVDSNEKSEEENVEQNEKDTQEIQELQELINESTVDHVLDMVNNSDINIDEAIAYETVGKNRTTLIDKLEELKQGE